MLFFKTRAEHLQKIPLVAQQILGPNLLGIFHQNDQVSLYLQTSHPKELPDFYPLLKSLGKAKADLAYLFTPETILTAQDTFPMEFLDLRYDHTHLWGTFPFEGFTPQPLALRLQCERELRGLLIHLRREYLLHSHSNKELKNMVRYTMPRFQPIFLGIYALLNGMQLPLTRNHCLETIDTHWNLGNLFNRLHSLPKSHQELKWLVGDYILGVESILKTIDRMEVSL